MQEKCAKGELSFVGRTRMMYMLHCLGPRLCRLRTLIPAAVTAALLCGVLLTDESQPITRRSPWMDLKTCSPRTNIAFLKTHKCASSAMQNILFRYGDKHNLNFALPDFGNYFGGGRRTFRAEMVLSSPINKLTPNILACHTKWNHAEVKKVMPEDTVYFTIVREPTALFESLFVFSKFKERTGLTLEEYVKEVAVDGERLSGFIGYNQMTWDLGMQLEDYNNLTAARELVRQADEHFGLVLVADRMEESLVLLAKYLCWELSDVLVLKLNSLRDEFKTTMSEETRRLLQQKLAPDYLLYNHFLERFDQQVEAFGRGRMGAAVSRLRELKALLVNTCNFVQKEATQLSNTHRPWSDKVDGYVGEGGVCGTYTIPELRYIEVLRKKQQKKIIRKFGLPQGPPLGAIPLGMNENWKKSGKIMRKKTLTQGNPRKSGGKAAAARAEGHNKTTAGGRGDVWIGEK